jgi:large subunit ribosomal protein L21
MEKLEKYAIIKEDGKQWVVAPGGTLFVYQKEAKPGENVVLSNVIFYRDGDKVVVGRPKIDGASVTCEVVKHFRGQKIIVFKKKRRKNYKRTIGHRQNYTELRVKEISLESGAK